MVKKVIVSAMLAYAAAGVAQTATTCSNMTLGPMGALNGFIPSPNDAWHQDVSTSPVDPSSSLITSAPSDLNNAHLHPDFSSVAGGNYGIPYTVVDSAVTPGVFVPIKLYPTESDLTMYPIPAVLPVEGNPGQCPTDGNDRHAIILDRNTCVAYELYQAAHCGSSWTASSSALWDFTTVQKRPYGMTSVDAAGLSVFEGLIRYDEIVAGNINHAIRFTAQHTKANSNGGFFTAPATHAAGSLWGTDNIMGMRIRLRANFDISGYSSTNQVILRAMKQYGMILADNGSNMFFQGTPDARWNDTDLSALKAVPSTAFDVVQMNPVYDSVTAPTGKAPAITSFTASSSTVPSGTSVTLTPVVTGASYSYIDSVGFIRGPVTVTPSATTTYMLTSRNQFGTTTASTTITVQAGGSSTPNLQFAGIGSMTFGGAPFAVSASSASTGAIQYSVVSGPASISGNMVTLNGVGTVVLRASQAAAGNYTSTTASTSFAVTPGASGLAFVPVGNKIVGAAPFTVSTTTKSAGSISYSVVSGPASVSGNTVTVSGPGTVALQASQAAAGNYTAASATTSFTVTQTAAATTLTFVPISTKTFGSAAFAVSATSSSPGAISYSVLSGPASISGNTVTLTGTGTVTLQAKQLASGSYLAASTTTSFTVSATAALLTFPTIASQVVGAYFHPLATSPSWGNITYSVVSGPAYMSYSTCVLTGAGTVTLRASLVAAGSYGAATATMSFAVN